MAFFIGCQIHFEVLFHVVYMNLDDRSGLSTFTIFRGMKRHFYENRFDNLYRASFHLRPIY